MTAGCPSAKVDDAVGKNVQLLRGDDCGVRVSEKRLEAGGGGAIVGDDIKVRATTRRGFCP